MNKNVVLFLTSPNNVSRIKMCLENFKQLEKLGFDIITLTTTDLLPNYIYEKSKFVIHDYTSHICDKKTYYNYYKKSGGGYFIFDNNPNHKVVFFHDTHFPSLLRNTRSLITAAKSFGYEKYFYVEDDHFFHDRDLDLLNGYFNKLDENDLIFFTFKVSSSSDEVVRCTYFNFGKVDKMYNIAKNFAYTEDEYKTINEEIYVNFFERTFTLLINKFKSNDDKILDVDEYLQSLFKHSSLNMVYSYRNLIDDGRCNFILDVKNNKFIFYYLSSGLLENVDLKIYVGDKIHDQSNMPPGCWYLSVVKPELINQTKIVINDTTVKQFNRLNLNDIIYNGEFISYI